MNSHLIDQFEKLTNKYKNDINSIKKNDPEFKKKITAQKFKIRSVENSLAIIRAIKYPITNGEQLKEIKGIGKSSISKINEILNTGTLDILNDYKPNINSVSEEKKLLSQHAE